MQHNSVRVEIMNQVYTINGDAPAEHILQLADYINGKMRDVCSNNANCSPLQAAILVALNITDEYFQLKKIQSNYDGAVEQKAQALISMLEEGLIGDIYSRVQV